MRKEFVPSSSHAATRGVWLSLLALIASFALVGSAGAAPLPLTNDIAPFSKSALEGSQGTTESAPLVGNGFTVMDSTFADRPSYTLRLVANGQNVEALRGVAQAAANDVATATGAAIYVAPGTVPDTVPDREPAVGEILLSVDDTTPCGAGMAGCGGPRSFVTRPSDYKKVVQGGRIWIYTTVLGYTAAQQSHVVEHELGHALGLAHHDSPYEGADQVMHSTSYSASAYRNGDRNGLAYLNTPPTDLPRVAFADAANNTITDWAYNPTSGWQQAFRGGHLVASGSSPSAVMADHVPHMFFVDATNNNTITDWNWTASGWQQTPFWGHQVAAGTSPTAVVVNGMPRVYFVDATNNNTITEWAWTSSSGWQQIPFWGHAVAAGTKPAAIVVNGMPRAYFVDAANNNTITEWAWTPSGWQQTPFWGHPVAAGSSPSAVVDNGIPEVFFVDETNKNSISRWAWNGVTGWQQTFLYGHPVTAGSSPSAMMSVGTPHVYFSDASAKNTLVDWTWNPTTGWQQTFMYGHSLVAGTSPSGF